MSFFGIPLQRSSQRLRNWATVNNIAVHPDVDFVFSNEPAKTDDNPDKEVSGSLLAQKELSCPEDAENPVVLLQIPRRVVLTESTIIEQLEDDAELKALFDIAGCESMRDGAIMFLLSQLRHAALDSGVTDGEATKPWYGYISFLPEDVPVPTLWDEDERQLLKGTSLEQGVEAKVRTLGKEYQGFKASAASLPFWNEVFWEKTGLTERGWLLADAWYRSRSLELPFSGHALVPVVDMVNHSADPTAYWEETETGDVLLLLRPGASVSSGDEITISYGEGKPKAEMLYNYGFMDTESDAERIRILLTPARGGPLDMLKLSLLGEYPRLEVTRDAQGDVAWSCPYAWLQQIELADGLEFKVDEDAGDETENQVRLYWQGDEVTDKAKAFDSLTAGHNLRKVFEYRVMAIVEQYVSSKVSDMSAVVLPEELVNDSDANAQSCSQRLGAALFLSEKKLLEALAEKLALEKGQLEKDASVVAYLGNTESSS